MVATGATPAAATASTLGVSSVDSQSVVAHVAIHTATVLSARDAMDRNKNARFHVLRCRFRNARSRFGNARAENDAFWVRFRYDLDLTLTFHTFYVLGAFCVRFEAPPQAESIRFGVVFWIAFCFAAFYVLRFGPTKTATAPCRARGCLPLLPLGFPIQMAQSIDLFSFVPEHVKAVVKLM